MWGFSYYKLAIGESIVRCEVIGPLVVCENETQYGFLIVKVL